MRCGTRSSRCTGSTAASSCSTTQPSYRLRDDGLQQADAEIAGGGRRRPGARAPHGQPRALPRAPAAGAARPGAAAAAGSRRGRAARAGRSGAPRQAGHPGSAAATTGQRGALARARPRFRRGKEARGRLRLDRAPAARARRRPPRRSAGEDRTGARRPARHLAGSRGHLPGTGEVRPRPDRARRAGEARPRDRSRRGDPPA